MTVGAVLLSTIRREDTLVAGHYLVSETRLAQREADLHKHLATAAVRFARGLDRLKADRERANRLRKDVL